MEDFRTQFMLSLMAYAVQRDADAAQLCRLSGVDGKVLQGREKQVITRAQGDKLWLNAAHLVNDTLFGLHFGESLQLAALGVVGQIIQSAGTVGDALQQAASLAHFIDDALRIEVVVSETDFVVKFIPGSGGQARDKNVVQHVTDLFMVFTLHEMDGLLLTKLQPTAVTLPHLPESILEYQRVFRCRNIRRGKSYTLSFPIAYWSQPVLTANYEMQHLLLKTINGLLEKRAPASTLQSKIYHLLLTNAYLGIPTLEGMAANLNTSPRSLQRKLQEEGASYQVIADGVRKSLAMYYLQSGSHPLKEISYILGYNDLSAFTRAFKRWTGSSPARYLQG